VILTRNKLEMTNLFIPGFWKHSAIVIVVGGIKFVIEAVDPLVRIVPFEIFIKHHDWIAIYRAQFMDVNQRRNSAFKCMRYIMRPYDYCFEPGNKELFCSELITEAINSIMGDQWTQREIHSHGITSNTTLPSDFANSSRFHLVTYKRTK
jgi:hypothetical protein